MEKLFAFSLLLEAVGVSSLDPRQHSGLRVQKCTARDSAGAAFCLLQQIVLYEQSTEVPHRVSSVPTALLKAVSSAVNLGVLPDGQGSPLRRQPVEPAGRGGLAIGTCSPLTRSLRAGMGPGGAALLRLSLCPRGGPGGAMAPSHCCGSLGPPLQGVPGMVETGTPCPWAWLLQGGGPRTGLHFFVVGGSGRKDGLGKADGGEQKAAELRCSKVRIWIAEAAKRREERNPEPIWCIILPRSASSPLCSCCFQLLSRSFLILGAPRHPGCGCYRVAWDGRM